MKSLQKQLDDLKSNNIIKKDEINKTNNMVDNKVNKKPLLSMSPLAILYLFTAFFSLLNKVPGVNRMISVLNVIYGRTTLWKLLVLTRKLIITLNAVIGVFFVYKFSGIGPDTILSNFAGMGYAYLDILSNMTSRLFNWFFNLFVYKIVPNVPNNKNWFNHGPINGPGWFTKPMVENNVMDVLNSKEVTSPVVNDEPKSLPIPSIWSNWLWILGSALGIVTLTYFSYLCYSYFYGVHGSSITPASDASTVQPEIALSDRIHNILLSVKRKLNPINWFRGSIVPIETQERLFIERQMDMNTYDKRYYPHTSYNLYDSIWKKLKLLVVGESATEELLRNREKSLAFRYYDNHIKLKPGLASGTHTPSCISQVGLGLGLNIDNLATSNWAENLTTQNKLNNLPGTPKGLTVFDNWVNEGASGSSRSQSSSSNATPKIKILDTPLEETDISEAWKRRR